MSDAEAQRKVLVVEDAEATWTVQEMSLVASGYDAVICTDGADALDALATEDFDLVVLDLALPSMDGWGVLERLRAEPRTSAVPVLIVTARDDSETRQKAKLAGADAFLAKPFDVFRFQTAVGELVGAA